MKPDFRKIPRDPGVYLYYDRGGSIIYIGKAKNLRARVRSYWIESGERSPAHRQLMREIAHHDFIVVNNETEALLLEAGLIKKHQPKYNIVLRDDKSWMYIVITDEPFPRVIAMRGRKKWRGEYFGPYTKGSAAKTVVRLLHRVFPLRMCTRDLSKLPNGLVCAQYHLGNCRGPCQKLISADDYRTFIEQCRQVLKGKVTPLIKQFEHAMQHAASSQKYEQAALYRDKIKALHTISKPQDVVHPLQLTIDSIGIMNARGSAVITVVPFRSGRMLDVMHYPLKNYLHVTPGEVLEHFVTQYYTQFMNIPNTILLPEKISAAATKALAPVIVAYPKRGVRRRLLQLAQKNAWAQYQKLIAGIPLPESLYSLKESLALEQLPRRIEAYDISTMGGSHAVGAMVVSHDGKLAKSEYRVFKIRTVHAMNDVAMLREVVVRRIKHTEWPMPDLMVLDGGKAQLTAVHPILVEDLKNKVIALAKKQEEIFTPRLTGSIKLPRTNPGLKLVQVLRDEAHRSAISFYRKLHRKKFRH